MLGDNIKIFRKNKGITQEQLAVKLNVVRQTVSKWEKNLSVPDAETLTRISEVLEVSVSELLGTSPDEKKEELGEVAVQLQSLNDLLATQAQHQRKITKKAKLIITIIIIALVLGAIYPAWNDMWYELGQNLYRAFHS
ncbi:MAG: helix-turn-helix transcriptional regulator [Acutalibacteraceae bacterium]|nr:helix-turn-helix transcriptional regulator [Acutalibacteraceae bacterium]